MSRRTARKHIFNMIFQTEFHSNEELEEHVESYSNEISDSNQQEMNFIKKELFGIIENKAKIDETINMYAEGWSIERISKVDIAILRLAVYEILFANDIPTSVSVNEAVELAKEFSGDKAPKFVNAVLGKISKSIEGK